MHQLGNFIIESKERASGLSHEDLPVYGVDRLEGLTPNAKYKSKDTSKYKTLRPGMFAYNPMRLNIGSIAYCSSDYRIGLVSPDYVVFRCDEEVLDPDFLSYVIKGPSWQQWVNSAGVGSVRIRIYFKELATMPFKAPSLPEQKAIAHILGSLDDKIELNQQMNATLEGLAQALFQSWFVDFDPVLDNALAAGNPIPDELLNRAAVRRQALDNGTANREAAQHFPATFQFTEELGWIPEGWDVMQWGDIAKLEYGKSLKGYRDGDGSVPVYGTNGAIGLTDKVLCESEGIIIGRKGAYRGVHFSPVPFYVIDTAFYLSPQISISNKWAYYEILGFDINGMDSGSAIPSTSRDDFYRLWSVFPAANIQTEFERIISSLYEKKLLNDSESESLSKLRDTLLPQLISGELRIPDAAKLAEAALA